MESKLKQLKVDLVQAVYDRDRIQREITALAKEIDDSEHDLLESDIPYDGFSLGAGHHFDDTILYNRKDHPNGIKIIDLLYKLYSNPQHLFASFGDSKRLEKVKNGEPYFSKSDIRRLISERALKIDYEEWYGLEPSGEIEDWGKKWKVIILSDPNFVFPIKYCHIIRRFGKTFRPCYFELDYYDNWIKVKKEERIELQGG